MKCCVAFEALLLLLVTQAASAIYHACNPSSKNVLAKYDDGIYYQTKITSVSENKISVRYLDNIKRTVTPDKVKIVTSTKAISPQTIENCEQKIYCVEARMWGRAEKKKKCQKEKLKWIGDDDKTKRDCLEIEIIGTAVPCNTANAPDTTTSKADPGKATTSKADPGKTTAFTVDSGKRTTSKADPGKQTTSTADPGRDAVDATDGGDGEKPASGAAVAIVVIIVLIALGGAGFAVYWFLIRKARKSSRIPTKDLEMGDQEAYADTLPQKGSNVEAKHSDSEDSTIDESDEEQSASTPGKPALPSQPKPAVPDLSREKSSSMNDYSNDYNPKGLPQPAPENDDNNDYNSKGTPQPAPENDDTT